MNPDDFIHALAQYLAGRQVELSVKSQIGTGEGKQWSDLRSKTPLFGYPTVEEAEEQLTEFLRGDNK